MYHIYLLYIQTDMKSLECHISTDPSFNISILYLVSFLFFVCKVSLKFPFFYASPDKIKNVQKNQHKNNARVDPTEKELHILRFYYTREHKIWGKKYE
jgi:hypothetical protein